MLIRIMFSFIEKVFQPSSGNLGLIFFGFLKEINFGMLFILQGLEKMFSFIEKCFPKFIDISKFQPSSGNLG